MEGAVVKHFYCLTNRLVVAGPGKQKWMGGRFSLNSEELEKVLSARSSHDWLVQEVGGLSVVVLIPRHDDSLLVGGEKRRGELLPET